MHSTGNSIQSSVGTYMGRKSRKEGMYIHKWLIHVAVEMRLLQYCKAAIPR